MQLHDDKFLQLIDKAIEKAAEDPDKFEREKARRKFENQKIVPVDEQDSFKKVNEDPFVRIDSSTAPENFKRFWNNPLPIKPGKPNFETGLQLNLSLLAQNIALKAKDFDKYKELLIPQVEFTLDDLLMKGGDLELGREDSDMEEIEANPEKVNFADFDTDSLLNEIKKDVE